VTAIALERLHLLAEREAAELVRRSSELKSALLASLSHDLRTPLTALTVATDNLSADWLGADERRRQIEIARAELARLNRLFENIVEMARIETQSVTAEPDWVQPAEIVETAMRQVQPALAGRPIDVDADEPIAARLDPRLTSAALSHLLENAAQYSPPGSRIEVRAAAAGDEVRFTVRDRGPGIDPAELPRLFERFFRGRAAGEHRFGTGMGLSITRGLLAAEGGRVWAENHLEGGALFTIAVPAPVRQLAVAAEDDRP
jgi:two-component system sensor histidine kinase KdpD